MPASDGPAPMSTSQTFSFDVEAMLYSATNPGMDTGFLPELLEQQDFLVQDLDGLSLARPPPSSSAPLPRPPSLQPAHSSTLPSNLLRPQPMRPHLGPQPMPPPPQMRPHPAAQPTRAACPSPPPSMLPPSIPQHTGYLSALATSASPQGPYLPPGALLPGAQMPPAALLASLMSGGPPQAGCPAGSTFAAALDVLSGLGQGASEAVLYEMLLTSFKVGQFMALCNVGGGGPGGLPSGGAAGGPAGGLPPGSAAVPDPSGQCAPVPGPWNRR